MSDAQQPKLLLTPEDRTEQLYHDARQVAINLMINTLEEMLEEVDLIEALKHYLWRKDVDNTLSDEEAQALEHVMIQLIDFVQNDIEDLEKES